MVLCRVKLDGVTKEDLVAMRSYYFFKLEQVEEEDGSVILNAMGGEKCNGINDFGENCKECRYQPEVVLRYLRKQEKIEIR